MPFKNTLENCQYFLSFLLNLTRNNLQILLHSHCEVSYRSFQVKRCGGGLHRTVGGLIMVSIIVSHQVQVCAECALDASSVVFSTMEVVSVCLAAQEDHRQFLCGSAVYGSTVSRGWRQESEGLRLHQLSSSAQQSFTFLLIQALSLHSSFCSPFGTCSKNAKLHPQLGWLPFTSLSSPLSPPS